LYFIDLFNVPHQFSGGRTHNIHSKSHHHTHRSTIRVGTFLNDGRTWDVDISYNSHTHSLFYYYYYCRSFSVSFSLKINSCMYAIGLHYARSTAAVSARLVYFHCTRRELYIHIIITRSHILFRLKSNKSRPLEKKVLFPTTFKGKNSKYVYSRNLILLLYCQTIIFIIFLYSHNTKIILYYHASAVQ